MPIDPAPEWTSFLQDDFTGLGSHTFTADTDGDTIGDATDNCPAVANTDQANHDSDQFGDVCDTDDDNDGIADGSDACAMGSIGVGTDTDMRRLQGHRGRRRRQRRRGRCKRQLPGGPEPEPGEPRR